jgi:hypothetical protein
MSHTIGVQAKTRLQLAIVNESDDGSEFDIAMISGLYGLRVLRELPRVRVFGHSLGPANDTAQVQLHPLGLSDAAGGHLLAAFCSQPLPETSVLDQSNQYSQWREISIEHPEVGKTGTSNLVFGTVYRHVPALNQPLNLSKSTNKPVETLLFDVLKRRGRAGCVEPRGEATLGDGERFGREVFPLKGKFKPERLGLGPDLLATPEIPHYRDLLRAVADKLNWDIEGFDAWRIRAEFPIYQSNLTMSWPAPDASPAADPS